MTPRQILTLLSAGRIAIGLLMVLAPRRVGRGWLGDGGKTSEAAALTRVAGIRDAAVGAGGLAAARSGTDPRPWLGAAATMDGVDAWATMRATDAPIARRLGTALFALSAGALSAAAALGVFGEDTPPQTASTADQATPVAASS